MSLLNGRLRQLHKPSSHHCLYNHDCAFIRSKFQSCHNVNPFPTVCCKLRPLYVTWQVPTGCWMMQTIAQIELNLSTVSRSWLAPTVFLLHIQKSSIPSEILAVSDDEYNLTSDHLISNWQIRLRLVPSFKRRFHLRVNSCRPILTFDFQNIQMCIFTVRGPTKQSRIMVNPFPVCILRSFQRVAHFQPFQNIHLNAAATVSIGTSLYPSSFLHCISS